MTEYPYELMRNPAETMRRAAARMREREDSEFWRALADWFKVQAVNAPEEGEIYLRGGSDAYALATACAYLTETELGASS